ncbi:unnamed protein product [Zymoseptoria tritici ST99CH_1E4]|uniref:Uncharacterized protein n=1 Tax=Zymoseptoria tritici ST99CH_1E4 TaxID=1276532 RepID=A0A2H1GBP7_ZYMTR|nr:unnamed protein product [Zymoseptoria tritici ST99CH_1E4]
MAALASFWNQGMFIPKPTLTEANLPDQSGRVFIVTGGYAGVGYELSRILYNANGVVYVAGRSADKGEKAISEIKQIVPSSKGRLEFLKIDLADLTSIKPSVEGFLAKEERLDVLINNAGVMTPPAGSLTTQKYDLQVGTNCLGHHLLTKLLHPLLTKTAESSPPASVRVAWAGSLAVDAFSPKGGVTMTAEGNHEVGKKSIQTLYGESKAGNYFLAAQFAKRNPIPADGKGGVLHVAFNPGNLKTELGRHQHSAAMWVMGKTVLYPAVYGAYTELFCGWSPELTKEKNGCYVVPWGRLAGVRKDVQKEIDVEGGNASKFYEWCERETSKYA